MKHTPIIFISILMLATACSPEEKNIERTAKSYLTAMGNYQFTEAGKYASEETKTVTLKFFSEVMLPHTDPAFIESNTPATIEITKTETTTDSTAFATYTKRTPLATQHDTLRLIKENGEWKADVVIAIPSMLNLNQGTRKIDLSHIKGKGDTLQQPQTHP